MKRYGALLGVLVLGALAPVLHAQERKIAPEVLEELFSTGTHAYYAGELRRAYDLLSEAIDGGLADARVFYMRGVVLHALGRPEQGERDFRRGAELEVRHQVEPQDINGFLSRVQGRLRVKLENIRRAERVRVLRRIQAERRARYQAMLRRQREVSVPEESGADPLADQGDLPAELASQIKRPQVTVTEVEVPESPVGAKPQGSPQPNEPAVVQNEPTGTPSNAPKPKPGTLKAAGQALGKFFGGLFRPPANFPQGGVPLPGGGGPGLPGPPQPETPQGNNPFDF